MHWYVHLVEFGVDGLDVLIVLQHLRDNGAVRHGEQLGALAKMNQEFRQMRGWQRYDER